MKRTCGLCLTAGLILAVVFLFQLSTNASDKSPSSITFTRTLRRFCIRTVPRVTGKVR